MSGSKEDTPAAPGEHAQKAAVEAADAEARETPGAAPAETEMTAAEALAQATRAAAGETPEAPPTEPEPPPRADDPETAPEVEPDHAEATGAAEPGSAELAANEEPQSNEPAAADEPESTEAAVSEEPASTESAAGEEPASTESAAGEEPASTESAVSDEPASTESAAGEKPASAEPESAELAATDPPEDTSSSATDASAPPPEKAAGAPAVADEAPEEQPPPAAAAEVEAAAEDAPQGPAGNLQDPAADPAADAAQAATKEVEAPADDVKPAAAAAPAAGKPGKKRKPKKKARRKPAAETVPDRPELRPIREAIANRDSLEGRVIGWNNGGFHLALGELSAFCPRSEMELGEIEEPETYLDRTFMFRVLRLQGKGRRIVVSRAAHLRNEQTRQRGELRKKLEVGAVLEGTVASLKDFGAFVELGGAQGLVHVSEIAHRRVEHPSDVLSDGQQVQVKVLKVEQGGRRISLSMRALEPDPWKDLADRFPRGAVVKGTVEKANQIGAFIELAPGLTGLLPARSMPIPRETTPARAYPPGKEVSVQIVSVDPRRQRIALALEGSGLEGSRNDYKEYQRQSRAANGGEGFNALASAFRRLQGDAD